MEKNIQHINLDKELTFSASLSSGPGGQHVNKVNIKVELRFNIPDSCLLSDDEKSILKIKLKSYITSSGDLIISSQTERSQLRNKETALQKFYFLIHEALKPPIERKPTKPTKSSIAKHRKNKIMHSEKKKLRQKPSS